MADTIIDIIIRGTNKTKQALNEPIKDLGDLKGALKGSATMWAAMAAAAGAAILAMTERSLANADALNKMAQKTGISTETLSTMSFAADLADVNMESLSKGLAKMSKAAVEAAQGADAPKKAFAQLGVSVTDAEGRMRSTEALTLDLANAFQKLPDGPMKAKLAMDVFGKAGADMIPFLNQGAAGIAKMQDKARALGQEISTGFAADAEQFNDTIKMVGKGVEGSANSFTEDLLPALQVVADDMEHAMEKGNTLRTILDALMGTVAFLAKVTISAFTGIVNVFDSVATAISALVQAAVLAATGDFKSAGEAIKNGFGDITAINEKAQADLAKIWGVGETGPKPPDPNKHREANDEIVANSQESKVVLDTQRQAELEAIKAFDMATVQSRLIALEQKRQLNQLEAQEFKALKDQERTLNQQALQAEKLIASQRKQVVDQLFSNLISLSQSKNAVLVAISRTAAVAQATMAAWTGANEALKAFAAFGPGVAFTMSGLILASGLANAAVIAGVPGFAQGGIVPGTSFSGDRLPAMVNSGELILNRAQQENLAPQLGPTGSAGGGSAAGDQQAILQMDGYSFGQIFYRLSEQGLIRVHPRAIGAA